MKTTLSINVTEGGEVSLQNVPKKTPAGLWMLRPEPVRPVSLTTIFYFIFYFYFILPHHRQQYKDNN